MTTFSAFWKIIEIKQKKLGFVGIQYDTDY